MKISFHPTIYDKDTHPAETSWSDAVRQLTSAPAQTPTAKDQLRAFCPADRTGPVLKTNITEVHAAVWDLDNRQPQDLDALLQWLKPHAALHYRTWSDGVKGFCARVIVPLATPVTVAQWPTFWTTLNRLSGGFNDPACKDPSRMYYFPHGDTTELSGPHLDPAPILAQATPHEIMGLEPTPFDAMDLLTLAHSFSRKKDPNSKRIAQAMEHVARGEPYAAEGERDSTAFRVINAVFQENRAADPSALKALFQVSNRAMNAPDPDYTDEKIDRAQRSALKMPEPGTMILFDASDHYLAQQALSTLSKHTVNDGLLYQYQGGIWTHVARSHFYNAMSQFVGAYVVDQKRTYQLNDHAVRGAWACANELVAKPGFFESAIPGIAFKDKFVSIEDGQVQVHEHSPRHGARHQVPVNYDPDAECPEFEALLVRLFEPDHDREDKIALLQEFVGGMLAGVSPRYDRVLMMVGTTANNGKSTLISLIGTMFPDHGAIPLQDWDQPYNRAELSKITANLVTELPASALKAGHIFKAVVSGDPLNGREIRQSPFKFRCRAGHIFALNKLPNSYDRTDGFWRRILLLTFNRKFTEGSTREDVLGAILPHELPGIYNWAFRGFERLVSQGRYTRPASHEETLTEWKHNIDPSSEWLDTQTVEGEATFSELFAAYERWCTLSGVQSTDVMGKRGFGSFLKRHWTSRKTNGKTLYPVQPKATENPE